MLSNAEIKQLSELKERSGRREQAKFLIEGKRAVIEALSNATDIKQIIVNAAVDLTKFSEINSTAEERSIKIEEVPATKFNKLSSTETSQGIIAVAEIPTFTSEELLSLLRSKRNALILILDRISDPGNLGTILRSAAWFGVDAVLIAEGSVDAYNPKVVRSAMSAIAQLNVLQEAKLEDEVPRLKAYDFTIIASSQNGKTNYAHFVFPKRTALVFGSEASGIAKKTLALCDDSVFIPRVGKMESLNVSVASSIILSEIIRQQSKSRGDS